MGIEHKAIQAISLMRHRCIALREPRNIQLQNGIPPVRQCQTSRILEHLVSQPAKKARVNHFLRKFGIKNSRRIELSKD